MNEHWLYEYWVNLTNDGYYNYGYYTYSNNYTTAETSGSYSGNAYSLDNFLLNLTKDDYLPDPLPLPWQRAICFLYIVIMIIATVGNIIVIWVISRYAKLQTVTNCFLCSLAVSDLCMSLLNVPFTLLFYIKNEWLLGDFWCKFSNYLQAVFIVSTILTLTVVAVDRYYAILFPLKVRHIHTTKRSVIVIATIWVTSLIVVSPQVAIQRLRALLAFNSNGSLRIAFSCVEYFGNRELKIAYSFGIFTVLYLIPVVIMVYAYGAIVIHLRKRQPIGETARSLKERKRYLAENKAIVRMLIIIVLCFLLAWFPFFSCQLYLLFHDYSSQAKLTIAIFQLIGFSNACMNPLIYSFLNENFRVCTKNLFLHPCKSRRPRFSSSSNRLSNRLSTTSSKAVVFSETTNM